MASMVGVEPTPSGFGIRRNTVSHTHIVKEQKTASWRLFAEVVCEKSLYANNRLGKLIIERPTIRLMVT